MAASDDGDAPGWLSATAMGAAVDKKMVAALWRILWPAMVDGSSAGVPVRRSAAVAEATAFGFDGGCGSLWDVVVAAVLVLAIALSWSLAASSGETHAEDHSPNASCPPRLGAAEQTDNRSLGRAAGTGSDIENIGPAGCSCRTVEYTGVSAARCRDRWHRLPFPGPSAVPACSPADMEATFGSYPID